MTGVIAPSTSSTAVAPGSVKVEPWVTASAAEPFKVTTGAILSVEEELPLAPLAAASEPTMIERVAVPVFPAASVALYVMM